MSMQVYFNMFLFVKNHCKERENQSPTGRLYIQYTVLKKDSNARYIKSS